MAELRLVGMDDDGQHLLLTDDSGEQHTVAIDERIRAAVNGHLSRLGQLTMALESRISPREIQDRIRAGESAEHVAMSAGVPLERVLRFVGPVLREREHVADQAKRARVGTGPAGPASLLVDVVNRAAAKLGVDADEVSWDSARREDHSWIVNVTWPDGSAAAWALDLLRHQATPVDATARRLSGVGDDSRESAGESDTRDDRAADDTAAERDTTGEHDTAPIDPDGNVRPFLRRVSSIDLRDASPHPHSALDGKSVADATSDADPDGEPESGADSQSEPDSEPDSDSDTDTADASGISATSDQTRRPPAARRNRSHRRARVPKWDDIMFGPKSKD